MTLEEAAAYVEQDLGMASEQAERLVKTVERHADGRISSVELVQLVARIKETYVFKFFFVFHPLVLCVVVPLSLSSLLD